MVVNATSTDLKKRSEVVYHHMTSDDYIYGNQKCVAVFPLNFLLAFPSICYALSSVFYTRMPAFFFFMVYLMCVLHL